MNTVSLAETPASSAQTYARIAGTLFLILMVAGGLGELYLPSRIIVRGDAVATANNIIHTWRSCLSEHLFTRAAEKPRDALAQILCNWWRAIHGVLWHRLGYSRLPNLRSEYLPKALGALLAFAGLGFITRNFVLVLAPAYASGFLLLPMMLGGLALTVWLLVKGVDVPKWEAKALTRAQER